ncbi:hypothetical protein [Paraburkholderia flagellata]|uniref:hypothetical protein n=1 Tax=Paraburkholderia flagellata TaxID=2883241 RepID=UPI001F4190E9|nr:hypothetical protein [Paraburkholderia flagellata]
MDTNSKALLTTVMLRLRVSRSNRQNVLDVFDEMKVLETSMTVHGAVDTWLAMAEDDETIVVFTRWKANGDYAGWIHHPHRAEIVKRLQPFLLSPPIATFFVSPGAERSYLAVAD